nr:DNA polymerase ligase N-terminal domain-containing protein [Jiangella endophytica]
MGDDARPAFVLHEHRRPRHHFDLRLEEDGVLRSWAVPRGLPGRPGENRLAVEVPDHDLDHLGYEDEHKSVADTGWWEEHDRTHRRMLFTLHGRNGAARYALIRTGGDWLLRRTLDQPDVSRTADRLRPTDEEPETPAPERRTRP